MAYTPTSWQNRPSTATPRNATNLNKQEVGIEDAHLWQDTATITNTTDIDITLDSDQNRYGRIIVNGSALTTARNLIVSTIKRRIIVENNEGFALTVKTSAGTGISVSSGAKRELYCDGTNVVNPTDDAGILATDSNTFTKTQYQAKQDVAEVATVYTIDFSLGYVATLATPTGAFSITGSNAPTALVDGNYTVIVPVTAFAESWNTSYFNTAALPAALPTTGTLSYVHFQWNKTALRWDHIGTVSY